MIRPHHLYIFTDQPEQDASALQEAGFTEGPGRIHVGQGTQNRKFYWSNFFLELLWVYDPSAIQAPAVAPTCLWQRSEWSTTGYSRFGLCLQHDPLTNALFENAWPYQPAYFPEGTTIDMINDQAVPAFPALFRLPLSSKQVKEPAFSPHANRSKTLTQLNLEYNSVTPSQYELHFLHSPFMRIAPSNRQWVHLYFEEHLQQKQIHLPDLCLSIYW